MADDKKSEDVAKGKYVAKQEVRIGGMTYGVGDKLPADIDAEAVTELKALGAI